MMKKIFVSIFVALLATAMLAENNMITYTAKSKLRETEELDGKGLHILAFNVPILSHTFDKGNGVIIFQSDVTKIGTAAFLGCNKMTAITLPESVTSVAWNAFEECRMDMQISVPEASLQWYREREATTKRQLVGY